MLLYQINDKTVLETIIKKIDACDVDKVSFLFEESKFTYIKQQGKNIFEKQTFSLEKLDSISKLQKILNKLDEDHYFDQKYKFVDISILNDEFTIIPLEYFDEDTAESFLNHNVPYSKNKGLRFNFVPQFNVAIIFYYHEELENILAESSEKIRITHTAFKLLSKIKDLKKDGIFINFYNKNIEIAAIKEQNLVLYNIYPFQNINDFIYFIKLITSKLHLNLSDISIFYFGKSDIIELNQLSDLISNIEPGTNDEFERNNFTTLDLI